MNTLDPPSLFDEGWRAESVRVTFFPREKLPSGIDLSSILDLIPERVSNFPGQGIRQEAAPFGRGQMFFSEAQGRLDIVYGTSQQQTPEAPLVYVGPLKEAFDHFGPLARAAASKVPPFTRMAVGSIGLYPTTDQVQTAELFLKHLPNLPVRPTSDSELYWALNRQRPAKSLLGRLNCIWKWQAHVNQLVATFVPFGAFSQSSASSFPSQVVLSHYARVEIDVNTLSDTDEIVSDDRRLAVFDELFGVLTGLMINGMT